MNHRLCRNCSKPLPKNATIRRKFCDAHCRVEHSRWRGNTVLYSQAMQAISLLGTSPRDQREKSIESLKALKQSINHQLLVLGDRDAQDRHAMRTGYHRGHKND